MPGIDFRAVRTAVSMQQVLDLLHFEPTESSGDQRRGPCPVHRSKAARSRAFSANVAQHSYQCFKCLSEGNQLDLWANANRQSLYAAAIDLCERLGHDVPWIHHW
jgi:DNA primase